MGSQIPHWLPPLALATVFTVMLSLGLMLGREQIAAALQRRVVLAAILFGVVVPVPAMAVLCLKVFGLKGAVAVGIILMAISPGAPVALRRAIDAGGQTAFAPALHLAIVTSAVVTVPVSVAILSAIFNRNFSVSPLEVARQVFIAQLLPLALGAAFRALRPESAARIEPRLARVSNALMLCLLFTLVIVLWPLLKEGGGVPFAAGIGLTGSALLLGAACAGRDASARPVGAIAAAMRNPGLALLIATVNKMPATVITAIFGYALGMAAVVTVFVAWQGRRLK